MAATMRIDGGCHCGAIAFAADIDPARVSVCHCNDCQTLTGSPFRVTVLCPRDAVATLRGTPATYIKTGESGRRRQMHFCRDCGTPLFACADGDPSDWGIRWGAIRQRAALAPQRQIWCRSAVSWTGDIAALPDGGNP